MTATVASHARRRTVAAAKKSARNNNKLLCIDLLRQSLHLSPFTPMIQHELGSCNLLYLGSG